VKDWRSASLPVLLVCLAPLAWGNEYVLHMLCLWVLYSLLALSLNIVVGFLGELTFGHAAFFGVGAYTSALLVMQGHWPLWLAPLAAAVVAGALGWLIGHVSLRIVGPQFAILTLGFGAISLTITNYWVDLTRGPMGLSQIPSFAFAGLGWDFSRAEHMYPLALLLLGLVLYGCHALQHSRSGRAFVALRENPALAASIGIDVFRTKRMAFVAATALAGFSGALYAHYLRVITPELMSLSYMSAMLIMVVIGGKGSLIGPVLGALLYTFMLEALRSTGSWRMVVFAALLIACVVFLPGGLVSLWRRRPVKEQP
jgi:branched-chain amino acid transport system permease protein